MSNIRARRVTNLLQIILLPTCLCFTWVSLVNFPMWYEFNAHVTLVFYVLFAIQVAYQKYVVKTMIDKIIILVLKCILSLIIPIDILAFISAKYSIWLLFMTFYYCICYNVIFTELRHLNIKYYYIVLKFFFHHQ